MIQTVKVRLRKATRVTTFVARDITLSHGDACILRTDRGLEYGVCVEAPKESPPEMDTESLMPVVRKATYNDESTYRQLFVEEEKAKTLCLSKIEERKLPMRLVEVEYTFDKHKIVFYFTADERVDFRELVRDLAHELKTRIELRHIQVRDKSRQVGGLAACGRELCCATWLNDFLPISMKMAKKQNLSLNPTKISGQCGRLMCCLAYENECYPDRKKQAAAQQQSKASSDSQWDDQAEETASSREEEAVQVDLDDEPIVNIREIIEATPDGAVETILEEDILEEEGDGEVADASTGGAKPAKRKRRRRRRRKPGGNPNAPSSPQTQ